MADGHAVNAGGVSLVSADDKSELRSLNLIEDGRFDFQFVPEGEYILHIANPPDMTIQPIRYPETGLTDLLPIQTHTYASVDLPISVHSNPSNVNVSLPNKPADKSSATAQKQ